MRFPSELKKGGTVALVSPSSPLSEQENVDLLAAAVEELGYRVRIGASCRGAASCGYSAASPELRAADLHSAFADPGVDAIWCTRGGSTAWQLLPLLDAELIRANPKPLIGFSDVTTLHLFLQQRCGLVSYHGPTANRTLRWKEGKDTFSWPALLAALEMGEELPILDPPGEEIALLRPGRAEGELIGGNLSLVAASVGTPWQVESAGRILFLEDVGEAVYSLERMLCKLKYAGILDAASGILLGAFTSCRNAYRSDYGPEALLRDFFADHGKPVLYNCRSAHCDPMLTLPMGARCVMENGMVTVYRGEGACR